VYRERRRWKPWREARETAADDNAPDARDWSINDISAVTVFL